MSAQVSSSAARSWLVRAANRHTAQVVVGVLADGGLRLLDVASFGELLTMSLEDAKALATSAQGPSLDPVDFQLLPPVDGDTEVWAAGVTYESSRIARMEESESRDVYELVYDAKRPELFFKSHPWKVTTDGEVVALRTDSDNDVPEPELALLVNCSGEILGYTVANDMSSRSIEGENPLYVPQAKVYAGSCALGPTVRPAWEIDDPYSLTIDMTIEREGDTVFTGTANTSQLHRRFDDLVDSLFLHQALPEGAVLSTGTCVVPPLSQPCLPGDRVSIKINEVGSLVSTVIDDVKIADWLIARRNEPLLSFAEFGGDR